MTQIWSIPEHLRQRAEQRGYTYAEVQPCILERRDGRILVDTSHAAYPMHARPEFLARNRDARQAEAARRASKKAVERGDRGPGTELKAMLRMVGITASPGCKCNARAEAMDREGCWWCLRNVGTIVSWLKQEAEARKLPFSPLGARALVYVAIARAAAKHAVRGWRSGKPGDRGNEAKSAKPEPGGAPGGGDSSGD